MPSDPAAFAARLNRLLVRWLQVQEFHATERLNWIAGWSNREGKAMRHVSVREMRQLDSGKCPVCSGETFQPGPRGTMAQTFECVTCGARFNLIIRDSEVLYAEHIGSRSTGPDWTAYRTASPQRLIGGRE